MSVLVGVAPAAELSAQQMKGWPPSVSARVGLIEVLPLLLMPPPELLPSKSSHGSMTTGYAALFMNGAGTSRTIRPFSWRGARAIWWPFASIATAEWYA